MLKPCPECSQQVSDKAYACPHCGYPIKTRYRPSTKRMRLPNGFGSITLITHKDLRKPYLVRVTVGKDPEGRCIQRPLKPEAYFKTYNEAYTALTAYRQNPYDLKEDMTVKELYERWSAEKFEKIADKSITNITNAWSYCGELYNIKIRDLRPRHIKHVLENGGKRINTGPEKGKYKSPSEIQKKKIKSLFNTMLDYAVEYELVERNCARAFSIEIDESNRSYYRIPFTLDEVNKLRACGSKYALMIVVQCYMGLRPGEICDIEIRNVDLDRGFIKCGSKTDSGIDRMVPVHKDIRNIIEKYYEEASASGAEYLFNNAYGDPVKYHSYLKHFHEIIDELGLNPEHKPHDPRMTFISSAKECKMNDFAIKRIVGHSFKNDLTESVYTKRPYTWLAEEMDKYAISNNLLVDQIL